MVIAKEKLSDFKEKYDKAQKNINENSKLDPPTEPFRSHYAALDILMRLQTSVSDFKKNMCISEIEDRIIATSILAFVTSDIGSIHMFTENFPESEKYLKASIDLLHKDKLRPEYIIPYVHACNELGILWSKREQLEQAEEFLVEAESSYKAFKESDKIPLTLMDFFGAFDEVNNEKAIIILEKTYTLSLYFLAQVNSGLGKLKESANYCHLTVKRQLEFNDYEPIDWALNAATLSQYYLMQNSLKQSRYLLAAASYMLDQYETNMYKPDMTEEQKAAVLEIFKHRSADVARCWAKYGIYILSTSKDRLLSDDDDEDEAKLEGSMSKLTVNNDFEEFQNLNLTVYESQISDQFCLTFEDAKLVFFNVKLWLTQAKEYYTAENEASEYSKIIQDVAASFNHLAFFEGSDSHQCKLHKKSVDELENLLGILNPKFYLNICREVWYELGLTYSTMLDIKLSKLEDLKINEHPSPHALSKINKLCGKSIHNFQQFLSSYTEKETEKILSSISTDELQLVFYAYFHIARLYYKITTPDKRMQLQNLTNSYKYYNLFILGCEEKGELISQKLRNEIGGVCKEMHKLLPLKIKKIMEEINM